MNEWQKFSEDNYPKNPLVLGFDTLHDYPRILVCEASDEIRNVKCRDGKIRTFLDIFNSIAPSIAADENNSYWMDLPEDDDPRWNKFELKKYPHLTKNYSHNVLMKLHNGNYYTGCITSYGWMPAFSHFKWGELESIEKWMELSEPPWQAIKTNWKYLDGQS